MLELMVLKSVIASFADLYAEKGFSDLYQSGRQLWLDPNSIAGPHRSLSVRLID